MIPEPVSQLQREFLQFLPRDRNSGIRVYESCTIGIVLVICGLHEMSKDRLFHDRCQR